MSESGSDQAAQLVLNIDEALAKKPALTDNQLEDVRRLRAEIKGLCKAGKVEEAGRCEELALQIIRRGAPVPE